jgi:peptidoglycan/xylan/chitin deacetylase (PgdA/CDA1 family)
MKFPALGVSLQNQLRDAAARALFGLGASKAILRRERRRPIVLLYHNPNPAIFSQHLDFLAEHYAFVASPGTGDEGMAFERPSVSFTFDDGYRGVHTDILPLLRQANAPATMFIPTAFLGKRFGYEALKLALQKTPLASCSFDGRRIELGSVGQRKDAWHTLTAALKLRSAQERDDRIDGIIDELSVSVADIRGADVLARDELRVMSEQLEIGSHTVTHPNLSRLGRAEASRELTDSKAEIEDITGKPCRVFAYPIGRRDDYTPETVEVVARAGYCKAFTAVPTTSADSDFEYPRVGVGDQDSVELLCFKLSMVWPELFRMLI